VRSTRVPLGRSGAVGVAGVDRSACLGATSWPA